MAAEQDSPIEGSRKLNVTKWLGIRDPGKLALYYHGRGAQTDEKRPQARSPLRHVAQIPVVDPYWLKTGLHVSM